MVRQLASSSGIQSNVSSGRNGVVGTSDDRSTRRSIPRSTLAPAWLATARARSLGPPDVAREAALRRRPTPCIAERQAPAGADSRHLTLPLNRLCAFKHPIGV